MKNQSLSFVSKFILDLVNNNLTLLEDHNGYVFLLLDDCNFCCKEVLCIFNHNKCN